MAGLEGLQRDGIVPVVVEDHPVEVVEAAIDRKILAPVVLDTCIADRATRLDLFDAIRPAAQRWYQAARGELALAPPVLWKHRQLAKDQRQFPVAGMLEVEADLALAFGNDAFNIGVVSAEM